MSTQYLSYGVVDARSHSDRDLALLRTVELERAGERAVRRLDGGFLRLRR